MTGFVSSITTTAAWLQAEADRVCARADQARRSGQMEDFEREVENATRLKHALLLIRRAYPQARP